MTDAVGRRRFLQTAAAAAASSLARIPRVDAVPAFDLVIRGASVVDGTGAPAFVADVAVNGDAIAAVGAIPAAQGRRVLEAEGLTLTPGFIDIHSHSDRSLLVYPTAESRVLQGITTELAGNCGSSAAPLEGAGRAAALRDWQEDGVTADWSGVASYCARVEKTGVAVNHALLVGQGTLRENAIGDVDRALAADEKAGLLRALEAALDEGAWGLSTGLEYTPGRFTPTEELVEMARVVARRGGLYASHVRNEEAALLEAVDEALAIGRRAGVRVQVSHLKAAGQPNWPKQEGALHLIESARRGGVEARADAYPYAAYSTGLTVLLEAWVLDGGRPAMLARLRDPAQRARIREELVRRLPRDPGDPSLIVVSSTRTDKNRAAVGRTLSEIAQGWKVGPEEALLRLLDEEEGSVGYIGHGMSPDNVERVLAHPLVMWSTDGYSYAPRGRAAEGRPHPRSYGAAARMLAHHCRERKLFDLPTAVKKMTALPADQIGLRDRGRIARGLKADLVLLDFARLRDQATFEAPQRSPAGVVHVLVNGQAVVTAGAHTGARAGRVLRRA
jgi:N-acyl-D-amino-acid deacylase